MYFHILIALKFGFGGITIQFGGHVFKTVLHTPDEPTPVVCKEVKLAIGVKIYDFSLPGCKLI